MFSITAVSYTHLNGATCTNGEMLAVLWEDKPDTASLHSHLRNLIFDLSHTLEDAGAVSYTHLRTVNGSFAPWPTD